jgi:hypothetical protein
MQHAHKNHNSSLDTARIDFMDVYFELHQHDSELKKKTKARKKFEARRGIEEHQEKKQLQEALNDWWDDI